MTMQEEPTPVTGSQLDGAAGVIARSDAALARAEAARLPAQPAPGEDLASQIGALAFRLGLAEEHAAQIETTAHAARAEVRELRGQLLDLGTRVTRTEGRISAVEAGVTRIESAVVEIGAQVGRINMALLKLGALTIVGGAIANALMHAIGMQ